LKTSLQVMVEKSVNNQFTVNALIEYVFLYLSNKNKHMPITRSVSNAAELQQAFDDLATSDLSSISIIEDITTDKTLVIPITEQSNGKIFCLHGNGATIKEAAGVTLPSLLSRMPTNQTDALNVAQSKSWIIENLCFQGGDTGLLLGATFASRLNSLHFLQQRVNGFWGQFNMGGTMNNCRATNPKKGSGFLIDIGRWTGATNQNAQSNHFRANDSRVDADVETLSCFTVNGSSGVVIDHCIVEGVAPKATQTQYPMYLVMFDAMGSPNVKDFNMFRTHIETKAIKAMIKIKANGGYVNIDGLYPQYGGVLVDAEAAVYTHGYISRIANTNVADPNVPAGQAKLMFTNSPTSNAFVWAFDEMPAEYNVNVQDKWTNGKLPAYYFVEKFGQQKQFQYSDFLMNGKKPVTA